MEKLKLKEVTMYRDGGSRDLVDETGKHYFQDNSIGTTMRNSDKKGLVYSGNINNKPWPEPVKGFEIQITTSNGEVILATNKE